MPVPVLTRLAAAAVAGLVFVVAAVGCAGDGGDEEAFCATARRFEADNPAAVFARYDPSDPVSAAALLRDAGERLAEWAGDAPDEVADDIDVLVATAERLAGELEAVASTTTTTATTTEGAIAVDPAREVVEASTRVLSFTNATCEVDLDPAAS